jgi:hypothetical protein
VSDRERANFCDFLIPNQATKPVKSGLKHDEAKKVFDSLFKK